MYQDKSEDREQNNRDAKIKRKIFSESNALNNTSRKEDLGNLLNTDLVRLAKTMKESYQ